MYKRSTRKTRRKAATASSLKVIKMVPGKKPQTIIYKRKGPGRRAKAHDKDVSDISETRKRVINRNPKNIKIPYPLFLELLNIVRKYHAAVNVRLGQLKDRPSTSPSYDVLHAIQNLQLEGSRVNTAVKASITLLHQNGLYSERFLNTKEEGVKE